MARPARTVIANPTVAQIADAIAKAKAGREALGALGFKSVSDATSALVKMNQG